MLVAAFLKSLTTLRIGYSLQQSWSLLKWPDGDRSKGPLEYFISPSTLVTNEESGNASGGFKIELSF